MSILSIKLWTFADTKDGNDSDDECDKDGSSGIEDSHGNEEDFEYVFDGVEDVDELGLRRHGDDVFRLRCNKNVVFESIEINIW